MSNIAISELNSEATSLDDNDLLLVSKDNGGSFTSAKMKGSVLKNSIDITKFDSCDSLSENDYLLVDKATVNEQGEILSRTNQKLVGDYISKLIDKKLQTIVSSISSLRETIDDITDTTSGGQSTAEDYCILDGNLGILGTDIPNYNDISRWEIKFRLTQLTSSQYRNPDKSLKDTTCFYNYAITNDSKFSQFYNYGQRWGTDRVIGLGIGYSISVSSIYLINSGFKRDTTIGNMYWIGSRSWRNKTETQLFNTDYILTINKISGSSEIPELGEYDDSRDPLKFVTTDYDNYTDHLLSDGNWTNGLIGRFYYLKGYSNNDELKCNLTPVSKNSFVLLHDSVTDTNINFKGSGSATKASN